MAAGAPGGLTAAELAAAAGELTSLAGSRVLDALPLHAGDDLLLVLQDAASRKHFVHVALGASRARIATTGRRFGKAAFARGPQRDVLARELGGAELLRVVAAAGERRCELHFASAGGDRRLVVELFGQRGLWALLDAEGHAQLLSRDVETAVRTLRRGDRYAPPPTRGGEPEAAASRFAPPVLAAIDALFAPWDDRAEADRERDVLQRAAARALQRAAARERGLAEQLATSERSGELREQADLMLAYSHLAKRGATELRVPDPAQDGEERVLPLDPARPVVVQAQALYEKARRQDEGRAITTQRLAVAAAQVAILQPLAATAAALPAEAPDLGEQLAALRTALVAAGAAPPPPSAQAQAHSAAPQQPKPARQPPPGENFRRFVSAEGYPILVGRNNEQNDRLTMRTANGNDLWLHVGGGRAGSHVVIRLPKQKTASLETLLDAAALAVHFSKARGESRIDVIYTHKKHIRKPKGLPAGAVVPSQTRTITSQRDDARLQRLLASSGGDDA